MKEMTFKMPAEWAEHDATWLAWPWNEKGWLSPNLKAVQETYLTMLEILLSGEKVHLFVPGEAPVEQIIKVMQKQSISTSRLIFHPMVVQDIWVRDFGPLFVFDEESRKYACKWEFNAWGEKYPELMEDNYAFAEGNDLLNCPQICPGIVLEGGAIEINGNGFGIGTESSLLNPNRKNNLQSGEMEKYLKKYLGVEQMLWLESGIAGDDTDGHIDDIARFISCDRLVVVREKKNKTDENFTILERNWEKISHYRKTLNLDWEIIELPMPEPFFDGKRRLPASYANFYIANNTVLMPAFNHPQDAEALAILKECFPSRTVISIDCRALITGLGAIHCATQQEPR